MFVLCTLCELAGCLEYPNVRGFAGTRVHTRGTNNIPQHDAKVALLF
jgi:hypothetical protein